MSEIARPNAEPLIATAAFRAGARAPEFGWPDSGRIERPAVYQVADGVVQLPLWLGPHGSVFVVFRNPAAPPSERIISVTRDDRELLGTSIAQAQTTPRPIPVTAHPGIAFTRAGHDWIVAASVSGEYIVTFASGTTGWWATRPRPSISGTPSS